jgi:hypothetical protein
MSLTHWHLRITLESSAKQLVEELARADRRSAANYVRVLIEKDTRDKDGRTA